MGKVTVLIIDDSQLVREILTEIFKSDPDIEVVGAAEDPYEARELIKKLNPQVLTLDIEMPRMNGIEFLEKLMRLRPMPVVMVSSLTEHNAAVTLDALRLGAFDYVLKPKKNLADSFGKVAKELISKVKAAATSKLKTQPAGPRNYQPKDILTRHLQNPLILLGASTGGTEAVKEVLMGFSPHCPPILITQHIPQFFSRAFAARLNQETSLKVFEATENMELREGCAYVAPGGKHLEIRKKEDKLYTSLSDKPPHQFHRPSVDVMFESISEQLLKKKQPCQIAAALLTGMGKDGADGLKTLHEQGAYTIAQDEASSLIWGMPGHAVKMGAAVDVVSLRNISEKIIEFFSKH